MIDIVSIVRNLAQNRPVFHSEADFQHAVAWSLHMNYPDSELRLEVPITTPLGTLYVDLLVHQDGAVHFMELKYKSRTIDIHIDGERFQLQNHGAQPLGRYDFWKDVQRLESIASMDPSYSGTAIILTNDSAYWRHSRSKADTSTAFSLGDGRKVSGVLEWSDRASEGTKRGREESIKLKGNYTVEWADYSSVDSRNYSQFRYLSIPVVNVP